MVVCPNCRNVNAEEASQSARSAATSLDPGHSALLPVRRTEAERPPLELQDAEAAVAVAARSSCSPSSASPLVGVRRVHAAQARPLRRHQLRVGELRLLRPGPRGLGGGPGAVRRRRHAGPVRAADRGGHGRGRGRRPRDGGGARGMVRVHPHARRGSRSHAGPGERGVPRRRRRAAVGRHRGTPRTARPSSCARSSRSRDVGWRITLNDLQDGFDTSGGRVPATCSTPGGSRCHARRRSSEPPERSAGRWSASSRSATSRSTSSCRSPSERTAGTRLRFRDEELTVGVLSLEALEGVDIALSSCGSAIAKTWVPAGRRGRDRLHRQLERVPDGAARPRLVIPEVNPEALDAATEGHLRSRTARSSRR